MKKKLTKVNRDIVNILPNRLPVLARIDAMYWNIWLQFGVTPKVIKAKEAKGETLLIKDFEWTQSAKEAFYEIPFHKKLIKEIQRRQLHKYWESHCEPNINIIPRTTYEMKNRQVTTAKTIVPVNNKIRGKHRITNECSKIAGNIHFKLNDSRKRLSPFNGTEVTIDGNWIKVHVSKKQFTAMPKAVQNKLLRILAKNVYATRPYKWGQFKEYFAIGPWTVKANKLYGGPGGYGTVVMGR